jgi:hypothetical protein
MAKVKLKVTKADTEQAKKYGEFVQPPPNVYVAQIVSCEPGYSKGPDNKEDKKRPRLMVQWDLVGVGRDGMPPPENYSRLRSYVSFSEAAGSQRAQFAYAIGLTESLEEEFDGAFDTDEVVGIKALIRTRWQKNNIDGSPRSADDEQYAEIASVLGPWVDPDDEALGGNGDEPDTDDDTDTADEDAGEDPDALWTEEELVALVEAEDYDALYEIAEPLGLDLDDIDDWADVPAAILEAQEGEDVTTDDTDGADEEPF